MTETKKLADEITLYTISNGTISFSAMNYGCTITNIFVPNKNGDCAAARLRRDWFSVLEGWNFFAQCYCRAFRKQNREFSLHSRRKNL